MLGTIETKKEKNGFGFVKTEEGQSYFFHFTDVENGIDGYNELQEGDEVSFEIGEGRDGKEKAVNLVVA